MKTNKFYQKYILSTDTEFLVEYGNIQKDIPQVICVNFKTYLSSTMEREEGYSEIITEIMEKFKREFSFCLPNTQFDRNFIFDYNFLKTINGSFDGKILTFELFLKCPSHLIDEREFLEEILSQILNPLLKNLEATFVKHNISPKKAKNT